MNFMRYDSPFMTGYRHIVDYIELGILWIIASLPVITYGAATTAMLLTAEASIHKDGGKIFKTFWNRFKREFKEATLIWLIQLPLLTLSVMNVWLVASSNLPSWLQILVYLFSGVVFCWLQLWFGYLSKFDDKIRTVIFNSFCMALGNISTTLVLGVTAIASIISAYFILCLMAPLVVLIPGFYIMAYTATLRKLFGKYLPKDEHLITQE